jgi:hypothetical protein
MPTVLHPRAVEGVTGHPPSAVTVRGETFDVDENARVTLPDDRHVEALADTYDLDSEQLAPEFEDAEAGSELLDAGVEFVESHIADGVCPWCDEYEGDGVPQHASAAHPDDWAEYKEATE